MYQQRITMTQKAYEYIQLGLYTEAYEISKEVVDRWPQSPVGWAYMAELFGSHFGSGTQALEFALKGLDALESSENANENKFYETLLGFVLNYAKSCDEINKCFELINENISEGCLYEEAKRIQNTYGNNFNRATLFQYHLDVLEEAVNGKLWGEASSHCELAYCLLEEGETEKYFDILISMAAYLKEADNCMKSRRMNYGLSFYSEDRISLKLRKQILEKIISESINEDYECWNKVASANYELNFLDSCIETCDKALSIKRHEKAIVQKALAIFGKGEIKHYKRNFNEAAFFYKKALDLLREANNLKQENSPSNMITELTKEFEVYLDKARKHEVIVFETEGILHGLERLKEEVGKLKRSSSKMADFKLTPQLIMFAAMEKFDLLEKEQILLCTSELIEDMNYVFVADFIAEFSDNVALKEGFIMALAQIAIQDNKHGVSSREAKMALAILMLLDGEGPDVVYGNFEKYLSIINNGMTNHNNIHRDFLLHCIETAFGIQLRLDIEGIQVKEKVGIMGLIRNILVK